MRPLHADGGDASRAADDRDGRGGLGVPKEKMAEIITSRPLLRPSPTLAETAKVVSFVASEEANTLTGAIVNSSCGLVLD